MDEDDKLFEFLHSIPHRVEKPKRENQKDTTSRGVGGKFGAAYFQEQIDFANAINASVMENPMLALTASPPEPPTNSYEKLAPTENVPKEEEKITSIQPETRAIEAESVSLPESGAGQFEPETVVEATPSSLHQATEKEEGSTSSPAIAEKRKKSKPDKNNNRDEIGGVRIVRRKGYYDCTCKISSEVRDTLKNYGHRSVQLQELVDVLIRVAIKEHLDELKHLRME